MSAPLPAQKPVQMPVDQEYIQSLMTQQMAMMQ